MNDIKVLLNIGCLLYVNYVSGFQYSGSWFKVAQLLYVNYVFGFQYSGSWYKVAQLFSTTEWQWDGMRIYTENGIYMAAMTRVRYDTNYFICLYSSINVLI